MEDDNSKLWCLYFGLSLIMFLFVFLFFVSCADHKRQIQEIAEERFETYNEYYQDNTDKDSEKIILTVKKKDIEKANSAIINYISNTGGKLVSINGKEMPDNTSNHLGDITFDIEGKITIATATYWKVKVLDSNIYTIFLPEDEYPMGKLQDHLDEYLSEEK